MACTACANDWSEPVAQAGNGMHLDIESLARQMQRLLRIDRGQVRGGF